jgi:hypothetical protein
MFIFVKVGTTVPTPSKNYFYLMANIMDLDKIDLTAITENPIMLDELKALAKTGQKLDAILATKQSAFFADNFHNKFDGERVLKDYKVSPSLDDNLEFSLTDHHGTVVDPEYFLTQLQADAARSHYLKTKGKGDDKKQPNPWDKATFNRTAQVLMMRDNPKMAAQLQSIAGK